MKKLLPILPLLFLLNASAQDTSKVEQYCEIIATGVTLSKKITIEVDYGEERKNWKGNRVKDEEGKLKKFNSIIDALNYFGQQGWKLVNAYIIPSTVGSRTYSYIMKKEFDREEL